MGKPENHKLHEFMRKNMELAINDYKMIQEGDRVLVGLSGGADSFVLLKLLSSRKIYVTNNISIIVIHLDLGSCAASSSVIPY